MARDHAAPASTLALAKASSLGRGRVRPLAWCSRPRISTVLLDGARHNLSMTRGDLERLAEELGLDVVGAAPAEAYEDTERHIGERRERGLFADMKFTMAQPETSCHPERL